MFTGLVNVDYYSKLERILSGIECQLEKKLEVRDTNLLESFSQMGEGETMIFREDLLGNGCTKLEIEFEWKDAFEERQVALAYFQLCKRILHLYHKEEVKP